MSNAIASAIRKLGKNVVRVRYSFGEDWTGEPAIYFRIVLTDAASREDKLAEVTSGISNAIDAAIRPYELWGLRSYFTYRSKSEQDQLNDPDWA